ncbi:MAG: hypothetical protein LWX11_01050, partial [Firmicutes bacterium]|nr:hypothetical protein [Bacillota bacterium]
PLRLPMRLSRALRSLSLFAASLALAAQATMSLGEIRPGMKGYGRTVFKGSKIERFEFEVLGVQRNVAPGSALILVKASGGPLAETGILSGMSGSPCYIDGKLVGALSRGFPFEKEPIGAITPIGEMLEQLKEIPDATAFRTPLILPKVEPPKVLKSALLGQMIPLSDLLGTSETASGQVFPVFGSELGPEARAFWQGTPLRFQSAVALASNNGMSEPSPLEPGGMAAVMLVQGDMEMAASGTITYLSGKRVLLFGHPLFNLGPVDLPLWSATVAESVASYNASFKLAQPVSPVGALKLDRNSGVAGVLGAEARMVPLRVGLNLGGKRNLNFRFELMDSAFVTPVLAATVLTQTLNAHIRGQGFQSLSLQGNVKLAGQSPIQLENMVADLNSARLAMYVGGILQAITFNPFERPVIEGISLNVKAEERLDLTGIAGVRTLKARAKRGEVLPVLVTLQNIQGVRETATFNVNVPASARPGKATLLVGDGMSLLAADPDEKAVELTGLGDVVRVLNGALKNNHAYSLLVQTQPGAGLRGSRIEGIPPTVSNLLGSDGEGQDNRLQRRIISRALLPLEREVRGLVSLELEIE